MYPAAAEAQPVREQAGSRGLVVLKYTGVTDIDTYPGPVTGAAYLFGLLRMRGYVDTRDAPGMLEITEDGRRVFVHG